MNMLTGRGTGEKKRIEWVDLAKGICIILVIIGHAVREGRNGSLLRGLIFSFHMPLFFILSSVTFRMSENEQMFQKKTLKAAKHLLTPLLVTTIISIALECCKNISLITDYAFWHRRLYTLVFSSGIVGTWGPVEITPIGIPWFFCALFVGRTLFDYLHLSCRDNKQLLFMLSMVTGLLGIAIGQTMWLPFAMDIALAIVPLFYFGTNMRTMDLERNPFRKAIVWAVIWLVLFRITFPDYNYWTYMELAARRYSLFPICYIAAIAGTMFICEFSVIALKYLKKVTKPLSYIGKNSLYLLCVHIFDDEWSRLFFIEGHQFRTAVLRVVWDLIIFAGVMIIKQIIDYVRNRIAAKYRH